MILIYSTHQNYNMQAFHSTFQLSGFQYECTIYWLSDFLFTVWHRELDLYVLPWLNEAQIMVASTVCACVCLPHTNMTRVRMNMSCVSDRQAAAAADTAAAQDQPPSAADPGQLLSRPSTSLHIHGWWLEMIRSEICVSDKWGENVYVRCVCPASSQQVNMPYVMIPAFHPNTQPLSLTSDPQMTLPLQPIPCKPGQSSCLNVWNYHDSISTLTVTVLFRIDSWFKTNSWLENGISGSYSNAMCAVNMNLVHKKKTKTALWHTTGSSAKWS